MSNYEVRICVEELGKRLNLTLNADVKVDSWPYIPATYWEPESHAGWEVTNVTVTNVNGKLQRARFPKLFASLDGIVADMIEKDSDIVERQIPQKEEFEDYPDE